MNTQLAKLPDPLAEYAQTLLSNGFRVLVPDTECPTWIHFGHGDQIGYVEYAKYRGFQFSTVHRPSQSNGTGFAKQEYGEYIEEPTPAHAHDSFNVPSWASGEIKRYKSLEDYATYPVNSGEILSA